MFTRTLDAILALQNFTDVTHKGGKRTEVPIMCCGNGWGGFVPILTGTKQGRSLHNSRRKTTRKNKGGFIWGLHSTFTRKKTHRLVEIMLIETHACLIFFNVGEFPRAALTTQLKVHNKLGGRFYWHICSHQMVVSFGSSDQRQPTIRTNSTMCCTNRMLYYWQFNSYQQLNP